MVAQHLRVELCSQTKVALADHCHLRKQHPLHWVLNFVSSFWSWMILLNFKTSHPNAGAFIIKNALKHYKWVTRNSHLTDHSNKFFNCLPNKARVCMKP